MRKKQKSVKTPSFLPDESVELVNLLDKTELFLRKMD